MFSPMVYLRFGLGDDESLRGGLSTSLGFGFEYPFRHCGHSSPSLYQSSPASF